MEYRRLGKAGVKVSRICLGAGVRGDLDEGRFIRAIERAIDLGCNFIDCANNYGRKQSETILGRVIKGKRDDLVITSKVCSPAGSGPIGHRLAARSPGSDRPYCRRGPA